MSLLTFFQWCEASGIGETIRKSSWLFPVIEAIHLLGLGVIGGAVLVVDLRLLGLGLRRQSAAQLTRDAQPWLVWAFVGLVVTGIPQLMSNSIKEYYSIYFWVKMGILLPAFIFTFTIRRKVAMSAPSGPGSFQTKLVGLVSIVLWAGVAITARLIGLLS